MSAARSTLIVPAPAILECVALELGLHMDDLRGPRLSHSLNLARSIATLLLGDYTLLSRVEIGFALGRHSTKAGHDLVLSALKRRGDDERFRAALEQCRERVLQWDGNGHV